eukprot:scaffold6716_cov114-Isochrysis_galbana.AAC.6
MAGADRAPPPAVSTGSYPGGINSPRLADTIAISVMTSCDASTLELSPNELGSSRPGARPHTTK